MEGLKYNERTGEFEERPSGRPPGGGCAKRLFQITLALAAFAATAWIVPKWESGWRPSMYFGGVSAFFNNICPSSESISDLFSACWSYFRTAGDWVLMAVMLSGVIAFVWFYAKALAEVRYGSLVVYLGWKDFFKSAVWVVALPFGLTCVFSDGSNLFALALGLVIAGFGIKSFLHMVNGAFRYNSGNRRWLALFARAAVILFVIFAFSELHSRYERYKRGELGLIRGVLLPLAMFAYFYKAFVAPMIR